MDNDRPTTRYVLSDWEKYLAPQVRQVELLGEISLNREDTAQIGRLLGNFIQGRRDWGRTELMAAIRRTCPCTFAVFLVSQGLHDNNALDGFWPDVDQATGQTTDANWRRAYGRSFEKILQTNGLPLFPDVTATSFRYVSLILLHGGIPNYALKGYFNHLLRPALTKDIYANLPATELIEEWLLRYRHNPIAMTRTIERFFDYGGQIAEDFVERTRDMAHEFLETGLIPSADKVGLPRRIIEAFHSWAVEGDGFGSKEISRQNRSGLRLYRPNIRLDPWGEGVSIDLPPQQIPATFSQTRFDWEIKLDGQPEATLPLRLERIGYNLQTSFETLVLERAVATCEISLLFDGDVYRTWSYSLEGPLLVFDPARNTLLRWKNSLPTQTVWLLYPRDTDLEITGSAHKLEEFPCLPWGWGHLKGEVWDLNEANRLTLRQTEQILLEVPVRADEATKRPHLVGGDQLRTFNLIKTPLYQGSPPVVRIPLVGRASLTEELERWRLSVYNSWPATPSLDLRREPLANFSPQLIQHDGYVDLSLDSPALLGPTPMGNFTIRLRGPLGRDADLSLRLLPHLTLTGHERLYNPNPQTGPSDIELLVETEPGIKLEAQAEGTPCRIRRELQQGNYEVIVPPDVTEARLVAVKA